MIKIFISNEINYKLLNLEGNDECLLILREKEKTISYCIDFLTKEDFLMMVKCFFSKYMNIKSENNDFCLTKFKTEPLNEKPIKICEIGKTHMRKVDNVNCYKSQLCFQVDESETYRFFLSGGCFLIIEIEKNGFKNKTQMNINLIDLLSFLFPFHVVDEQTIKLGKRTSFLDMLKYTQTANNIIRTYYFKIDTGELQCIAIHELDSSETSQPTTTEFSF